VGPYKVARRKFGGGKMLIYPTGHEWDATACGGFA